MSQKKQVNGVNVTQLFNTIGLIKENPGIAQFKFKASNKRLEGTFNSATVKDFYGAGQEDDTQSSMVFDRGEPPVLCGNNKGANPVKYLLTALSDCLTTSLIAHASAKGIVLKGLESRLKGDIDLCGFLGLSEDSLSGIRI